MAASGMIPTALRAVPLTTLALLASWATLDVLAIPQGRGTIALLAAVAFGIALIAVAAASHRSWIRPFGLAMIGAAYLSAHAFFLGVQVVSALVFVAVLLAHVEVRILAERFAPLYERTLDPVARTQVRSALGRAGLRLTVAAVLAVVVPILAADLAVAGIVPVTTVPTAVLLAAALVAVVALLALLPSFGRRAA